MAAITTPVPIGERDEVYYWDNVCFSVEGCLFKVPRYPFIVGSDYFAEKYSLRSVGEHGTGDAVAPVMKLDGVPAKQFRLFLKVLFPLPPYSTAPKFTTDEWLTILDLATSWRFHDVRNLAIQHLDTQLTDLGFVRIGRAVFHPQWVLEGYKWLVLRPKAEIIEQAEADAIGHETACKLWMIRYQCGLPGEPPSVDFVERELRSRFAEELDDLERKESNHMREAGADVRDTAGVGESEKERLEAEQRPLAHDPPSSAADGPSELGEAGSPPDKKSANLGDLENEEIQTANEPVYSPPQVHPETGEDDHDQQKRLADERGRRQELMAQEARLREKEGQCSYQVMKWKGLIDNPGKNKRKIIAKWEEKRQRWNAQLVATRREIQAVRDQLQQLEREEQEAEEAVPQETSGLRAWGAVPVYRFGARK